MAQPSPTSWPRPAVPGEPSPPPQEPKRDPGQVAAAIATGVLCLWTPFTLILALTLSTIPGCANSTAAICTHQGHLAAMWLPTLTAATGLATVATGSWLYPRRHHAVFALASLSLAALGLLLSLSLTNTAP